MKIIHIISSLGNGGAEAILYRLIVCNQENTHVVVSLGGSDLYENLLVEAGVNVHLLNMKDSRFPIASLWKLHKIIRSERPDIVQNWMYHANLLGGVVAKLSGCNNIFWGIHMSTPKLANLSKSSHLINIVCAKLSSFIPSKIIACAHRASENHIKIGYDNSRMITICNGYDLSTFTFDSIGRTTFRTEWLGSSDVVVLGTLARWHPVKDHELMFKALCGLSAEISTTWKLILAGPDMNNNNTELVALVKKYGLTDNCILLDQITEISAFMSALDIHVLSSVDEGFPNVLAEAMACGTPCISTDCGDAAYIIGGTGWVCPIQDSKTLRAHISDAIQQTTDETAWKIRAQSAIKRIHDNFGIETMSEQYDAAWLDHIKRSNA